MARDRVRPGARPCPGNTRAEACGGSLQRVGAGLPAPRPTPASDPSREARRPPPPAPAAGAGPRGGGGAAFLGRWFTSGLASNSSWFLEKKKVLSMCKSEVAPAADGGLNVTSTFLRKDQCETRTLLLRPAGPPGCYSYTSPHWSSTHEVSVAETDYETYALLYTESVRGPGPDSLMATLYSRTQTPRTEVKEKFTTFARNLGFTEEGIVFLPKTDKCMEVHT